MRPTRPKTMAQILANAQSPWDSILFPALSFSEPSVGKSPELRENPSFLEDATTCTLSWCKEKLQCLNRKKGRKKKALILQISATSKVHS